MAIFTLIPSVAIKVDKLLANNLKDINDLERALALFLRSTNFTKLPNETEFLTLCMKICSILEKTSWGSTHMSSINMLVGYIIEGIGINNRWPPTGSLFRKPAYNWALNHGLDMLNAVRAEFLTAPPPPQEEVPEKKGILARIKSEIQLPSAPVFSPPQASTSSSRMLDDEISINSEALDSMFSSGKRFGKRKK